VTGNRIFVPVRAFYYKTFGADFIVVTFCGFTGTSGSVKIVPVPCLANTKGF